MSWIEMSEDEKKNDGLDCGSKGVESDKTTMQGHVSVKALE
jgi:hypothetical protein